MAFATLLGCDGGEGPVRYPPSGEPAEFTLSEVGLYDDIERGVVAERFLAFEPVVELWSDGATKRRWVSLPRGGVIDTSDPDHWEFPVGTQFFKEFTRDGVRVETRLVARTGPGPNDYWMGTFVWREDGRDADLRVDGVTDALGTPHDVPEGKACGTCHNGEPGRALGFGPNSLDGSVGATLDAIAQRGWFGDAAPGDVLATAPPEDANAHALGYLHINCGPCHNPTGAAWPDTDMVLQQSVFDADSAHSAILDTTVNVELQYFRAEAGALRLVPGAADASALVERMEQRGPGTQMPPLATEEVDPEGLALIRAWINAMPSTD